MLPMSEELPLNDTRKPAPKVGSVAWTVAEWKRFHALSKEHGGLTNPAFAAVAIGVSRQRVHQLINTGHLRSFEVLGKPYVCCNDVEEFAKLERSNTYRYGTASAA